MTAWSESDDSIFAVAHYLVHEEDWQAKELLWFFEKPWHYNDAHVRFVLHREQEEPTVQGVYDKQAEGSAD